MTRIAVVTHRNYVIPDDPLYIPLMAGSSLRSDVSGYYTRDDIGENISDRNATFSELTGLYWLWKNSDKYCPGADSLGICHYRRYFAVNRRLHFPSISRSLSKEIISEADADKLMTTSDVVMPVHRNYVIESNYSHYAHAHHAEDLEITRAIIMERCPEYLRAFDARMAMRKGHRFNMFIMKKELMDAYCTWLFDILFELERRLDISGYTGRDARVFGLVSERLIDVWIDANGIRYREIPYVMTEHEGLILKAVGVVRRKLTAQLSKRKVN